MCHGVLQRTAVAIGLMYRVNKKGSQEKSEGHS
jgi:hypothetical protein